MPGGRRGLVAPQNTFLENIIRRSNSQREYLQFLFLFKYQTGNIRRLKAIEQSRSYSFDSEMFTLRLLNRPKPTSTATAKMCAFVYSTFIVHGIFIDFYALVSTRDSCVERKAIPRCGRLEMEGEKGKRHK